MSTTLDPRVSIFETEEEATSYDLWFRAKVEAALASADDPATPRYSSDQVLREVDLTIKAVQARHASRRLAR
jgi:hypothetical protein